MAPRRELITAALSDAQAATGWVSTPEDTVMFAGPALEHPWTGRDLLITRDGGWEVYALHEGGRPVGVGSLRPLDDHARLGRLLIDPARRGQGLGRSLVSLLMGRARELGYARTTLGVYEQNQGARRLYESLGFVEKDRRAGHAGWTSIEMMASTGLN